MRLALEVNQLVLETADSSTGRSGRVVEGEFDEDGESCTCVSSDIFAGLKDVLIVLYFRLPTLNNSFVAGEFWWQLCNHDILL